MADNFQEAKFNLGDIVDYEKQLYVIVKILYMHPNVPSEAYVYGLRYFKGKKESNTYPHLCVRESLLELAHEAKIKAIRGLYGL